MSIECNSNNAQPFNAALLLPLPSHLLVNKPYQICRLQRKNPLDKSWMNHEQLHAHKFQKKYFINERNCHNFGQCLITMNLQIKLKKNVYVI